MTVKNRIYFFMCGAAFVLTNLITATVFAGDTGNEDSKIIWSCKKGYGTENVLWLVEWEAKSYVKVFDERIPARYTMDGLEKRWNWGLDKTDFTYDYAITLSPDRIAKYYDFTLSKDGTASHQAAYKCTKAISKTEAERRRKAAEKKRKEEEAARGAEAEEKARAVAEAAQRRIALQPMIDRYVPYIQKKVQRSWIRPPGSGSELSCTVEVRLIPSGEVIDAQIVRSSGNPVFDRSVESAVFKASPLPVSPDPEVMEQIRTLRFSFVPN